MILAKKVRIIPNEEQEQRLWQSVGTARFIYNWTLGKQEENYRNGGKFISDNDLRKEITILKKAELTWLNDVSNNVAKQSVKDACNAYKKFFKGIADKPRFKRGVDLGLKYLAIVSNIEEPFKNINKTEEVKRLKKKLKRKQKQAQKKYEKGKIQIGKEGENRYKFTKTSNIKKVEREIKLIQRRLSNIRLNHIHQVTTEIVKTKPSRIVVEDLNVKGMMKNKHLSKAIQEQCFHKFIRIIEYKSKFNGIEFVKADMFYPSSKTCSSCGEIKKDLKLKDRIFICPSCNSRMDRDRNASINLSRYKESA